jgi:hydrogenase/urease accessory protein HupE
MNFTLRQMIIFSGLAFTSIDVFAHINGSHDMGFVAGMIHFMTQPSHVLLLAPVIVLALGYHFRKRVGEKARRD